MLDKSSLKSAIAGELKNNADSSADFAQMLMDAYVAYAEKGEDISGDVVAVPLDNTKGVTTLTRTMDAVNKEGITESMAASMLSSALGTALTSVWVPGMLFGVTAPGVKGTVAFTFNETRAAVNFVGNPAVVVITSLPPTTNLNDAAGVWADAMHAFTQTVVVEIYGQITTPNGPVSAPAPLMGPLT